MFHFFRVVFIEVSYHKMAQILIRDEGSSGGTWVNGERLEMTQNNVSRALQLKDNDLLILGRDTKNSVSFTS